MINNRKTRRHGRRDEFVGIRLTVEELLLLRGEAMPRGKSLSEYIREAAVDRALGPSAPRQGEE